MEHSVVQNVGMAVLEAVLEWRSAFVEYLAADPLAKYEIEVELKSNERFLAFMRISSRCYSKFAFK